ncbi:MAG: hypothetical protein IT477_10290 [Rhodanobacteraceae bacterium]|nr:hypothetical protein [Rhodanobacteraceae bacterium]
MLDESALPAGVNLNDLLRQLQEEFLPGAGQQAGINDVVNPLIQSLQQGNVSTGAVRQAVSAGGAVGGAALCSAVGAAAASPLCAAAGKFVADTFADLLGIGGSGAPGADHEAMRKTTRAEKQAWMDKLSAIAEDQETIFDLKEIVDAFFNEAIYSAADPYSVPLLGGFFLGPFLYESAPWILIEKLAPGVADYVIMTSDTVCAKDANSLDYIRISKGFGVGCFGNPNYPLEAGSGGFGDSYIMGFRNWPVHIASHVYSTLRRDIPSVDDTRYTKEMNEKYGHDQPFSTTFMDWGWRDLLWGNVKNILNVELRARLESALIASKLRREGKFLPIVEGIQTTVQTALGCTQGDQECKALATTYTDQLVRATLNNDQPQIAERRQALATEATKRGGNTAVLSGGDTLLIPGGLGFPLEPTFTFFPLPMDVPTDEEPKSSGWWWKLPLAVALVAGAVVGGKRLLQDTPPPEEAA